MPRTYDKDFENLRRELGGVSSRVSQLRQRLDAVPAAVLIVDDTGRYLAANVPATLGRIPPNDAATGLLRASPQGSLRRAGGVPRLF